MKDNLIDKVKKCKNMSLNEVKLEEVDEITDIKINRNKPSNERVIDFIDKVKNPYIFKMNGRLIQIAFADTERSAEDCLTNVIKNLYKWYFAPYFYLYIFNKIYSERGD